jgi:allantoin racemase
MPCRMPDESDPSSARASGTGPGVRKRVLLVNPNSNRDTTAMMVAIAQGCAPGDVTVAGATATRSPPMIVTAKELVAAADEVIEIGVRELSQACGIIVSAFGDPGVEELRQKVSVPVRGLCEAAMIEAATGARRFGVATVTPDLAAAIEGRAHALNLRHLYTGIRLTASDPRALVGDAVRLRLELAKAVEQCFDRDGAEAVIIGGGPLGQAALDLARSFRRPIVAPIPAALRQVLGISPDGAAATETSRKHH